MRKYIFLVAISIVATVRSEILEGCHEPEVPLDVDTLQEHRVSLKAYVGVARAIQERSRTCKINVICEEIREVFQLVEMGILEYMPILDELLQTHDSNKDALTPSDNVSDITVQLIEKSSDKVFEHVTKLIYANYTTEIELLKIHLKDCKMD